MLGTIGIVTAVAEQCQECRGVHSFRIALSAPTAEQFPNDGDPMKVTTHGFFRPCRITGRRTWFVVTIPGHDGDITGIGPADDDHWDPTTETDDDLLRMPALQARDHVSPSDASGPTYGSRSVGETMRVLRQMLGCPLSA